MSKVGSLTLIVLFDKCPRGPGGFPNFPCRHRAVSHLKTEDFLCEEGVSALPQFIWKKLVCGFRPTQGAYQVKAWRADHPRDSESSEHLKYLYVSGASHTYAATIRQCIDLATENVIVIAADGSIQEGVWARSGHNRMHWRRGG